MRLSEKQIADIGLTAAKRILGKDRVTDARAFSGEDSSGFPAVYLEFLINRGADKAKAALLKTRLTQAIRDELVRLDEAKYPFVRVLDSLDWRRLER